MSSKYVCWCVVHAASLVSDSGCTYVLLMISVLNSTHMHAIHMYDCIVLLHQILAIIVHVLLNSLE
jgi:hypothetical protein